MKWSLSSKVWLVVIWSIPLTSDDWVLIAVTIYLTVCLFGVKSPTRISKSFFLLRILLSFREVAGRLTLDVATGSTIFTDEELASAGSVTESLRAAITYLFRIWSWDTSSKTDITVFKPFWVFIAFLRFFFQSPCPIDLFSCRVLLPPPHPAAFLFLEASSLDLSRTFYPSCDFCHFASSSFWSLGRVLNYLGGYQRRSTPDDPLPALKSIAERLDPPFCFPW